MVLISFKISSLQDSIRTFNDSVTRIGDLHSRSLNNTDDNAAQRIAQQLDELVAETSAMSSTLKRRIKALEAQGGSGRDGQIRKQQVCPLYLALSPLGRTRDLVQNAWLLTTQLHLCLDCACQEQVRRGHPKLSRCGAAIPYKV